MQTALEVRGTLPTGAACRALGIARATYYRCLRPARTPHLKSLPGKNVPHHRALSPAERTAVLDVLHDDRFADQAPAEIFARLLDEGTYLCSIRTMYRILADRGESRDRRAQTTHPKRTPPELVATAPNQVWTWDITNLPAQDRGASFKLYVVLDLYSRYAVGWYLSETESSAEAAHLFETLAAREHADPTHLIVHADNGGPMHGQPLAELFELLGIARSHSRPSTSNDNAFSESQFKTMKYRPAYPGRFESIGHARAWCREFFDWYNNDHHHESLGLLTPADVYRGRAGEVLERRAETLKQAHASNPGRFVRGVPVPARPQAVVAINHRPQPAANPPLQGQTQAQEVTN